MEYLIFLNRFELNKEKLVSKIKALDNTADISINEDSLIVNSKLNAENFLKFQEISKIAIVSTDWKAFSFKTIKEDCLKLALSHKIKDYFIDIKFFDKVPISAKSIYKHINPYLKHESILAVEASENIIYIELKKFEKLLSYKLYFSKESLWKKNSALKIDLTKFAVVIENPSLVSEVGDFLRLCWIFKLPLYVLTKNKEEFEKVLKKAKEETKGIDYDKFELKIVNKLPSEYTLVGFSKHSNENESNMEKVILLDKKIAFVFGDDKFGLTQETRDSLDHCFRLTPELKKPLRASHALSYILGFYTAKKI